MKRFSEQLQKKSENLTLRADEKRVLRERLVSYVEYHQVPKMMKVNKPDLELASSDPVIRVINVSGWNFLKWAGATTAILLLVVPYVAEKSIPGDAFYAIKVNFNEEVRSTLALNSYDKVVWETERLNRRIAEARLLSSEGKMTEELENSVTEAVRLHSENAKKEIEHLKQTNEGEAALASLQLDTTIAVQTKALRNDLQASSTDSVVAVKIVDVLSETQENNNLTFDDKPLSRELLTGQIENETTRAYELLNNIEEHATAAERSDIKRRLEDIDRKTEQAMQVFESSETEARKQMMEVLQSTQKLIVFMTNIDVRTSLTVDQIVPVTLTREERLNNINKQIQETTILIERTKLALTATTSSEIFEKVDKALTESENELNGSIIPALSSNDFDLADMENKVKSIYDTISDARNLTGVREIDLDVWKENLTSEPATTTDNTISTSTDAGAVATNTDSEL